ncbi:hypothetical protein SDC9_171450 [bioreactor metagenome]|uniref:Uncharacterized protein n=1 Tax=bioreactor metagenome TaxID=1076179 RepID=A0A645GD38_9ZZZZ
MTHGNYWKIFVRIGILYKTVQLFVQCLNPQGVTTGIRIVTLPQVGNGKAYRSRFSVDIYRDCQVSQIDFTRWVASYYPSDCNVEPLKQWCRGLQPGCRVVVPRHYDYLQAGGTPGYLPQEGIV